MGGGPWPARLATERLELRAWTVGDALALRAVLDRDDGHLRPWIPFMAAEPRSMDETLARLAAMGAEHAGGGHARFALWERVAPGPAPALVGEGLLLAGTAGPGQLELGYWLGEPHTGLGYATEACHALVTLAWRRQDVETVVLRIDVRNASSARVAERLGAERVGRPVKVGDPIPADVQTWAVRRPVDGASIA